MNDIIRVASVVELIAVLPCSNRSHAHPEPKPSLTRCVSTLEPLSVPEPEPAFQIPPDTKHEPTADTEPEPVGMSDKVQELAPMSIPIGLSVEPDGTERFPINPP